MDYLDYFIKNASDVTRISQMASGKKTYKMPTIVKKAEYAKNVLGLIYSLVICCIIAIVIYFLTHINTTNKDQTKQ